MKTRWRLCLALIAILCCCIPAFVQTEAPDLLKTADEMVEITARLRELPPKAPISKGVKSREEISQFLDERVQEEFTDSEIREEGKMLRKLGLIPESMDYREFVLNLLTEQVGGFYDPKRKSLFIASWLSQEEQKPFMVHELLHALQDQHFNIEQTITEDRKQRNDDRTLAHQAFFEGDGLVVMLNYLLEPAKKHFSQVPDLAVVMRAMTESTQGQYPVFKSAPAYLRETLIFPYGYGASFIQRVWARNPTWEAVNSIYSDLPESTEQIMHPEKYLVTRDRPVTVKADDLVQGLGAGWKTTYRNVLGEFSLRLLLGIHLSEERSVRSAAGWGGDQVLLLENETGKNAVLVSTVWDDDAEAAEFFASMQDWLQKKYSAPEKTDKTESGISITQKGEINALRIEGSAVRLLIGYPVSSGQKPAGF